MRMLKNVVSALAALSTAAAPPVTYRPGYFISLSEGGE